MLLVLVRMKFARYDSEVQVLERFSKSEHRVAEKREQEQACLAMDSQIKAGVQ